ncbi:MAG TPA: hypothetical protein VGT44_01840 [Ktedonobacteraceae bacterium]|nr:hypothetical protein [Ktedonobacteraceae bacterium]
MDLVEAETQSFIVKVWVEDSAKDTQQGVWHGHITHVPSHERRYLKNLGEIEDFIAPHLEEMGVQLSRSWRLRRWLMRLLWQR